MRLASPQEAFPVVRAPVLRVLVVPLLDHEPPVLCVLLQTGQELSHGLTPGAKEQRDGKDAAAAAAAAACSCDESIVMICEGGMRKQWR